MASSLPRYSGSSAIDIQITNLFHNWNFVSIPFNNSVNKSDIIIEKNNINYSWEDAVSAGYISDFVFCWDRSGQYYTITDIFEAGSGYWIYAYEPCILWMENITLIFDDYITSIENNWNIISVPSTENVSKYELIVNDTSWSDAVSAGIVSDFIFGWERSGQYYNFANTLLPGYAYWVYAYQPCILKRVI